MVSAWYSSMASINPDTRALARSIPFPCDTATERELGRHTITTGIPIESNPVTLATRVIPVTGARRSARFSVSSRLADRCVPRRKTFSVTPIKIRFRTGSSRLGHSSIPSDIQYGDSDLHAGGVKRSEISVQPGVNVADSVYEVSVAVHWHRNRVFTNEVVVVALVLN